MAKEIQTVDFELNSLVGEKVGSQCFFSRREEIDMCLNRAEEIQSESEDDIIEVLIELALSSDSFSNSFLSDKSLTSNTDSGLSSRPVPVETFVLLQMIGEKVVRCTFDDNIFIMNYMKKVTINGTISHLKMKLNRPSSKRLELDIVNPRDESVRWYYVRYPLNPNEKRIKYQWHPYINSLRNFNQLTWHQFSVLPCGSFVYVIKIQNILI